MLIGQPRPGRCERWCRVGKDRAPKGSSHCAVRPPGRSMVKRPKKIGIWIIIGRQPLDRIDPVILVELHDLLVHPRRVVFIFFASAPASWARARTCGASTCWLCSGAARGQVSRSPSGREWRPRNCRRTVHQIHEVEQRLANDLEEPKSMISASSCSSCARRW